MPDHRSRSATIVARLCADQLTAERVAELFMEHFNPAETAVGTFEVTPDWVVEVCFVTAPDQAVVRNLVTRAAGEVHARKLTFETLAERDWVRSSLAVLRPVEAGRFIVHGSHDRARVPMARIGIEIEAALAFGTGHHGTTRGCLLALDRILKARRPIRILDVGTGTGVLAIAAAKASRRHVVASDIDPRAVLTARANARSNRTGHLIEFVHTAGVTAHAVRRRAPFDLVFANVLLGPLQRLAHPLSRLIGANARVILSGLLPTQANAALAAYAAQGLRRECRIELGGWTTLVLARRGLHYSGKTRYFSRHFGPGPRM